MKKPMSEKTQVLKDLHEAVFPGATQAIEEHRCPLCKQPIGEFKDAKSVREYEISGLCQTCQNRIFG